MKFVFCFYNFLYQIAFRKKLFFLLLILFSLVEGCIERYNPPAIAAPNQYLVVDGFINAADSTQFTLSYSTNLSSSISKIPVQHATFVIEGDKNFSLKLNEISPGIYQSQHSSLDTTQNYRVNIVLAEGTKYLSEFVPVKISPPIDTIEWSATPDGIQIILSTHDARSLSHYYKWNYIETWKYHTYYYSVLAVNDTAFIEREDKDQIYYCWNSDTSSTINLGTSLQLGQDEIYRKLILTIPPANIKINFIYSILIRQFVLTESGFQYWSNLNNISSNTGSIFAPQPSQLSGNIRNVTNPNELVFGFISAGSLTEKRIYVKRSDFYYPLIDKLCPTEIVTAISGFTPSPYFLSGTYIPLDVIPPDSIRYTYPDCGDCRTKGGTTVKPSFWIQ